MSRKKDEICLFFLLYPSFEFQLVSVNGHFSIQTLNAPQNEQFFNNSYFFGGHPVGSCYLCLLKLSKPASLHITLQRPIMILQRAKTDKLKLNHYLQ